MYQKKDDTHLCRTESILYMCKPYENVHSNGIVGEDKTTNRNIFTARDFDLIGQTNKVVTNYLSSSFLGS